MERAKKCGRDGATTCTYVRNSLPFFVGKAGAFILVCYIGRWELLGSDTTLCRSSGCEVEEIDSEQFKCPSISLLLRAGRGAFKSLLSSPAPPERERERLSPISGINNNNFTLASRGKKMQNNSLPYPAVVVYY